MNGNPFSLTFGKEPKSVISNSGSFDLIKNNFLSLNPSSTTTLITGVRGSGKTVLLTRLSKYFEKLDDWVVVELNPEVDMLEYLAANLYERSRNKFQYMNKEFSFSFKGISFSISGDNHVSNVITLLERMFEILEKKNKKVLLLVDDISNNQNVKTFVQQYQIFIRRDYPLFLLMTGLYENVRSLQNEKSLTFLYRAPQVNVGPLSLINIADSFKSIFDVSEEEAARMAKLTNGYAFAYQVLGYILYESGTKYITDNIIKEFDRYLREYVYEKIYFDLPEKEKQIVVTLSKNGEYKISNIMNELNMDKSNISQYRDKLLKKGVLVKSGWGKLEFALPRFKEYVLLQQAFE